MDMLPEHWVALDRSIGPVRMGTHVAAAEGDSDRARALSLWDRELAAAFFADLAILEVALRNAMSARLKDEWGCEWYRNPDMPLDDRSLNTLSTAWQRITGVKTADRLVAQCMFGFWRGLLDAGSYTGKNHGGSNVITRCCGVEFSTRLFPEVVPWRGRRINAGTGSTPSPLSAGSTNSVTGSPTTNR